MGDQTQQDQQDMATIDMGGKKFSISPDMMPTIKDMAKGLHDMAQKMGNDTYDMKIGDESYKLPKKAKEMMGNVMSKMKEDEDSSKDSSELQSKIDNLTRQRDAIDTRAREEESRNSKLQARVDELSNQLQQLQESKQQDSQETLTEDAVIEKAQRMAETYEAGKPYFAEDKQPTFKEATRDLTKFMRDAILERFSVMDADQAAKTGWDKDTIQNWDAEMVAKEFEDMTRFLPPTNQDTRSESHKDKFDRVNQQPANHQQQKAVVPFHPKPQDYKIGQINY